MRRCFTRFPNWLFQENPIYTRTWGILQEVGFLLEAIFGECYYVDTIVNTLSTFGVNTILQF